MMGIRAGFRGRRLVAGWIGLLLLGGGHALRAQPVERAVSQRPVVQAVAVPEPPRLDGEVLGDPVWQAVPPATGFRQTEPREGAPASERTEVRLVFTDAVLYVGVICFDRDPSGIIVADSRRDASLDETDSFRFILDTYRDGRNGFVFGTNPAGIEYDAQVTNEGQGSFGGGRQMAGSGGGFNINWDGSWEVRTATGDFGWSAEFAIPFSTLRFPSGREQTWGINFQRTIRRRNEHAFWAPLPRQFNLNRVSLAGTLTGLAVPDPRNLKVMPYVLGQAIRDFEVHGTTHTEADFGVDLKYSLTPGLTLDATYNTDFAQVEVDEQQINLDRFSLFFPEKRPFFLENAGLFSVGETGEVELFFSRRIGLSAGATVPILGGVRLSGTAGATRIGLLEMQTEAVRADSLPANNFAVVRLQRELPNRSAVGVLLTNRQGTGDLAPDRDYNRLLAFDARFGLGAYGMVSGFVARSFTPGVDGGQQAFNLDAQYDAEAWLLSATFTQVGDGFNPEVGFLRRTSYRKVAGLIFHRFRPEDLLGFLELRPHVSYRGYWGLDGFQETGFLHIDNHWEWRGGYEIHTGINLTREGVRAPFEIADGVFVPAGTYDHRELQLVGFTNRGYWISLEARATIGGFFGGDRVSIDPTLNVRAGETLNAAFSLSYNDVRLPGGHFTTNLFRARLSYAFSPRVFIQSLVQYNDQAGVFSMNVRLGWLRAANTGLFIVFNQTSTADRFFGFDETLNRGLTVKYTHLLDVLR
ncbi:carbohydrate binding family 9 domain-containing protein [Rhodocaloribacter litoris]|uniref:DUF5916 domain-containing protein n=1 Tax=Rhodocaloribacter litoris TaxID=2558931 RepID=UPI001423AB3A|nr:DUF5916 domain-containing protein [Rhodocaloribacter litoris]QXD14216.1 carbohydrate binding family 9 domain-containing protein [Rhodocaloribacter litoris]